LPAGAAASVVGGPDSARLAARHDMAVIDVEAMPSTRRAVYRERSKGAAPLPSMCAPR